LNEADYFRSLDPEPLEPLLQDERSRQLVSLERQLNEEERELLRLRYTADLSYPQIGQVLKRSPEAVKKQLYRLLARLKAQMEAGDG
jgi:RNA polymerase sigma factor (sigma-70 family)